MGEQPKPDVDLSVQQTHGVRRVRKVTAGGVSDDPGQQITIADAGEFVRLVTSDSSYPAELTPAEARMLAQRLVGSANRADARRKARGEKGGGNG